MNGIWATRRIVNVGVCGDLVGNSVSEALEKAIWRGVREGLLYPPIVSPSLAIPLRNFLAMKMNIVYAVEGILRS